MLIIKATLMNKRLIVFLCLGALAFICGHSPQAAVAEANQPSGDSMIAAAREYVAKSDKYLHHSKLARGMIGYGKTVLAGTELVRFDVEIVSVMANMNPGQDMVLARLSGQNLEKTGVIAGMSGSPVYVTDPDDGKEKMIGAVAFGWSFQNEPLCGIQPITQMLAGSGMFAPAKKAGQETAGISAGSLSREQFLASALNPERIDYAALAIGRDSASAGEDLGQHLRPLVTPLMVSGGSAKFLSFIQPYLAPAGMMPVASGGIGQAMTEAAETTKLEPGSAIGIMLMSGDMDFTSVGTVTEVIDGRVLAFGHAMFGWGNTRLPMGTAYIHTVLSSKYRSFKMGSALEIKGAMVRDEMVGITGELGAGAPMFPVSIKVNRPDNARSQQYNFKIVKDARYAPLLTSFAAGSSLMSWHSLPLHHTISYKIDIDYGELGKYSVDNISSDSSIMPLISDMARPVWTMLNNPFAPAISPQRIDCEVTVSEGNSQARLLDMKLDGKIYKPGETVTGKVTIERYRKARQSIDIEFVLPEDIADGQYNLTACSGTNSLMQTQQENPHLFSPRTVEELFAAMGRLTETRSDRIYFRLPLKRKGLALGTDQMPELPPSRAQIVREAGLLDTHNFSQTLTQSSPSQYVISGAVDSSFQVRRRFDETRLSRLKESE